jgi:hypothetical protein
VVHLKTARNVSPKPDKSGVTGIERCLEYIQDQQRIVGAAPFVFQPAGPLIVDTQRVLNLGSNPVLQPMSGIAVWGELGGFPWLSKFLDGLFDPAHQLEFFISWFSRFYKSGYDQKPSSGQTVFLAGGPGVGKTFLSRAVVGRLVGGFAEAKEYLVGNDSFGSELFERPLWVVDDASVNSNTEDHRRFCEAVKRIVANRNFRYHAKFRVPLIVDWQGRVIITCNQDEESIRILPDMDISNRDKLMLFRTMEHPHIKFPGEDEVKEILGRELPAFARYLLDYQIPEHCKGDSRFGVRHYHEPTLVKAAEQSDTTSAFAQILHDWITIYFGSSDPSETYWEGSAFQLHKMLHMYSEAQAAMRAYNVNAVARNLAKLKNKGTFKIESIDGGDIRRWRIYRPEGIVQSADAAQKAPYTISAK